MEKEIYMTPEVQLIRFEADDVITTSLELENDDLEIL